jgi:hypothetical protein
VAAHPDLGDFAGDEERVRGLGARPGALSAFAEADREPVGLDVHERRAHVDLNRGRRQMDDEGDRARDGQRLRQRI